MEHESDSDFPYPDPARPTPARPPPPIGATPPPPPLPPEPEPPSKVTAGSILSEAFPLFFRYVIPILLFVLVIEVAVGLAIESIGGDIAAASNAGGPHTLEDESSAPDEEPLWHDDPADDVWSEDEELPDGFWELIALIFTLAAFGAAIPMLAWGAAAWLVVRHLAGRPSSPGDIGGALSGIARAFPAAVVVILCISLPFLPGLGFPLLVLAAFVVSPLLYCGLFVAIPAAMTEGLGAFKALERSWALTRGHKGSVFGVVAIVFIAAGIIISATSGELFTEDEDFWGDEEPLSAQDFAFNPLETVFQSIAEGIAAVAAAVAYVQLRQRKEALYPPDVLRQMDAAAPRHS